VIAISHTAQADLFSLCAADLFCANRGDGMPIRVFKCRSCGHRMRLAHSECGACYAEKPTWQKPATLFTIVTVPIAVFVAFFAFILLAADPG